MFVTKNKKVALKRAVGFIVFTKSTGGWIHKTCKKSKHKMSCIIMLLIATTELILLKG